MHITAWKVSKYGVFSGPYLDTFHAVYIAKFKVQVIEACDEEAVYITASGNILASGNLCFRVSKLH